MNEATDTELLDAPVSQAYSHCIQCRLHYFGLTSDLRHGRLFSPTNSFCRTQKRKKTHTTAPCLWTT